MRYYTVRTILAILFTLGLSSCAPNKVGIKHKTKDWRAANIHKVVVVCVQGNQKANLRIESYMMPILRHQGLDVTPGHDLFTAAAYSPKELLAQMQKAHVDGIMELVYSGVVPKEGLPQGIRFKYHSIKEQGVLDAELIRLMGGLIK